MRLRDLLQDTIEATRREIEKKQTRTYEEIEAERREEESGGVDAEALAGMLNDDEEDEDDAKISNPLNLPLDWTGKPIPYWLYKLHGLGVHYKCEICGNYEYHGKRNFEKHFQEARHSYGMKCLGIPNTMHFGSGAKWVFFFR